MSDVGDFPIRFIPCGRLWIFPQTRGPVPAGCAVALGDLPDAIAHYVDCGDGKPIRSWIYRTGRA